MNAYYKGQPIFGPRGPAGPDGNPIGTVISFMGTAAPKDYLVCDGAEYNILDYPELAEFFRQQFSTANYFGGDGQITFAVPDMRNLFLRGFHGEAEERLTGEVGQKQEGTMFPAIFPGIDSRGQSVATICLESNSTGVVNPKNPDTQFIPQIEYRTSIAGPAPDMYENAGDTASYTSRPVNMAVLYCIKAAESVPAENVYSTGETRIGTWIDGKPLYRMVFEGLTPSVTLNFTKIIETTSLHIETCVNLYAVMQSQKNYPSSRVPSGMWFESANYFSAFVHEDSLQISVGHQNMTNQPFIAVIEYTKATD